MYSRLTTSQPIKKKTNWKLAGGVEGGNYDRVAKAIASTLKSEGFEIKVLNTLGSRENINGLRNDKVDLCLIQNDTPGFFGICSIGTLYREYLHVLIKKDNINQSNLHGRTISIGPNGGGTDQISKAMLFQWGYKDKMDLRNESFESGLMNLNEGKVDAVFVVSGMNNPRIEEAIWNSELSLMALGNAPAATLVHRHPHIENAKIPAGTYTTRPGKTIPEQDLPTIGVRVVLACKSSLPNGDARKLIRSLLENRSALSQQSPILAKVHQINPDNDSQFPPHEGVGQYFRREAPGFFQRWSDTMALGLTTVVLSWSILAALRRILIQRKKDRVDTYFAKVDELITELVGGVDKDRAEAISSQLQAIRHEAMQKLIAEELEANESFVIL